MYFNGDKYLFSIVVIFVGMTQERSIDSISLHGGWLCLDFINTVSDRTIDNPEEYLTSYDVILKWTDRVGALPAEDIEQLRKKYLSSSEEEGQLLKRFIEVREVLFMLFTAIIHRQGMTGKIQNEFNEVLAQTLSRLRVAVDSTHGPSYYWDGDDLEKPLYPVIKSAYDLLLSGKLNRVKECGACGWVFLDKSKNNSRRWCDMQACGSAAKARRYYRKKKQEEQS